jgi:hypothetical protein
MRFRNRRAFGFILAALIVGAPVAIVGRQATSSQLTAAGYARAEKFLPAAVTPLVVGGAVAVSWLPDDRLYYRNVGTSDVSRRRRADQGEQGLRSADVPNQNHGYGTASAYTMRRRWDYFVRHLLGVEPPKEYQMTQ